MKLTIWTDSKEPALIVRSMHLNNILELKEALNDGEDDFLQFEITNEGGGDSTILINRAHIVQIDIDEEG